MARCSSPRAGLPVATMPSFAQAAPPPPTPNGTTSSFLLGPARQGPSAPASQAALAAPSHCLPRPPLGVSGGDLSRGPRAGQASAGAVGSGSGSDYGEFDQAVVATLALLNLDMPGPIVYVRGEDLERLRPRRGQRWLDLGCVAVALYSVEHGRAPLPIPPEGSPFWLLLWHRTEGDDWGVFQHCTPWAHEGVSAMSAK